jgi:hypothetical protein
VRAIGVTKDPCTETCQLFFQGEANRTPDSPIVLKAPGGFFIFRANTPLQIA